MSRVDSQAERAAHVARVTGLTIAVNAILTVARGFAGLASGSTAVLADAANSAMDIVASLVVLGGTRIAAQPPDEDHLYGHEKAEPVAAKVVAIIIIVAGVLTALGAWQALRGQAEEAPGALAAWVTAGSILIKEVLARYVLRRSEELQSEALAADGANQRTDVFASGAALAGVVGARMGMPVLDPIAGLLVAGLITRMGFRLYWDAVRSLMDTAPTEEVMDAIRQTVLVTPGVLRVDDVKARLHGAGIYIDLKICVPGHLTVAEGHAIAAEVKAALRREVEEARGILVHVNPCLVREK